MSPKQKSVIWTLVGLVALLTTALAADAIVEWLPRPSPFKRQLAAATLQFIMLTLAGGILTGWWVGRTNWPMAAVSPRATWIAVLAAIAAYAGGLSYLSLFRHQALLTGIYDLGYYAQLTWEVSQLQIPRSSIWHDAVWGNHATFVLYVSAVHRRPSGLGLAATAAAAFVLLIVVVIPSWIQTPYFSVFNRWRHLGNTPWELIASPVLRPDVFFGTVLQPERLGYLVLLLVPLAGLPLLAPEVLAVGLPPLVSNLLSSSEMQYTIRGHYTATLTPVLIAAAVVGSRRAAAWIEGLGCRPRAVLAAMATTSVIASVTFSPLPWSQDPFARKQFWDVKPRIALATFTSQIPSDATVSAANHLGAHFSFRKEIDIYPSGADTADFVLVDLSGLDYVGRAPNPEAFRPLLRRLVEARPLVAFEDDLALFGQGVPSQETVAKLVNLRVAPVSNGRPVGEFLLIAVSLASSRLAPREYLL